MKIQQKKYTHKVKLSTLRILEKNDFNYLKTAKLSGVSRATIKRWECDYGAEVFTGESPTEIALKEIDIVMKRNDEIIIKKYYTMRNQILDRIQGLIPHETKLEPLINALKSISLEIVVFDEEIKKEEELAGRNVFQEILKQIDKIDVRGNNSNVD